MATTTDVDLSQLALNRDRRQAPRVGTRRHVLTRFVLPALLLAGFLGLAGWSARDIVLPPQEVTVVPVYATHSPVRREGTTLFKAAGWIEPRPTPIRVAALAPGVVEELLVVEDQAVKAGEPVAKLVAADARLAYDRAVADLMLSQAEREQARATLTAATTRYEQPVHLQAPLAEAEAELARIETQLKNLPFEIRRAEAQLEFARQDYEGKLAAQGAVSVRAVDQARSQLETAQASLEELQRRLESLRGERTPLIARRDALRTALALKADELQARDEAAAKLNVAESRVRLAEVLLSEAELRLQRMTVPAPVDGRVLRLLAQPGTRLMEGAGNDGSDGSTVVTMYRPESLQVRADVRFDDVPKISLDQPVRIESLAVAEPLAGRVLFISSEADIQKNTLQVKVAIESAPAVFKPEMLVDVTFLAPPEREGESAPSETLRLLIPERLVQQHGAGAFVWVADQSAGVARKVSVAVGETSSDGLVEATGGLTLASRLIASGHERLEEGTRIRVTGEAPPGVASLDRSEQTGGRRALNRLPAGGTE